ncbi:MAG TPA: phosphatidate cytidylyltransferase [Micropepsaceae bacterium]|nr:phosphatidate cytidylyltransferase [Micropepsaceae bacterium]
MELPARIASAVVMGLAAGVSVLFGGIWFALIVALGALAALREWHRLINDGRFARETFVTGVAVVAAIWLDVFQGALELALAAVAFGAAAAALSAALRSLPSWRLSLWHAAGAIYIGLPALSLVAMRAEPRGAAVIGGLFVAVWTADTGALLFGRLIGGPKLAPVLSPNKTWAGFLGGTFAASVGEVIYVALLGGVLFQALIFGFFLALAGHCGDLFESWVKRRFHAKNTGRLIPGHGGMLDRIDSMLLAAPICAMLVFVMNFNPLRPLQ